MIEKAFLIKNGLSYDESLSVGEDGIFNIDLFSCEGDILEVPYFFLNYRLHHQSATGVKINANRLESTARSIELIQKRMEEAENPELKTLISFTLAIYCYFLHRDIALASSEIKEQFEHLITPELIEFYQSQVQVHKKEPL